jgi:hypothetical protein
MVLQRMPALLVVFALFAACAGKPATEAAPGMVLADAETAETAPEPAVSGAALSQPVDVETLNRQLDEIAELERSGSFVPGLGIAESGLRERSGDFAGAVLAVYKELSWAYGYGLEGAARESITGGLARVKDGTMAAEAVRAAEGTLAFFDGRWAEAQSILSELFAGETEIDAFSRWMLLVCSLETGDLSREARSAYGAVRARYVSFPEYWYRGARNFSGLSAGDYAERCINLAAAGPYAAECRRILSVQSGLSADDGPALRTRYEIEELVKSAVSQQKPEVLADLLPLVALPDNPYTVYASGVLRGLSTESLFKNWFADEAGKARGRLAERLRFITGALS